MTIEIAEGAGRKEKEWESKEVEWDWFVEKCSKPKILSSTRAEIESLSEEAQADIKGCNGAFVGGTLIGTARTKEGMGVRTLITLDADKASKYLWEDYLDIVGSGYAALLYSTFNHSKDKPRYRLVIPIDMESGGITKQEYEPLARKMAGMAGINYFDPTTFDTNRLMYYPAIPKDGVFEFKVEKGKFMTPDLIKSLYDGDWRDMTAWPRTDKEKKDFKSEMIKNETARKNKGNPTEIRGVVGAFCSIYTVDEAIDKFIPHIYEKGSEGRYSYVEGTSTNGLVLYDNNLFAYSNHATDPASGKEWNAFDLVALHKFGYKDTSVNVPFNSRPSHKAMIDFIVGQGGDKEVKALLRKQNKSYESVKGDFDEEDIEDDSWEDDLIIDGKKGYASCTFNVKHILTNDQRLKDAFKYNEFSAHIDVMKKLPWDNRSEIRPWGDRDIRLLRDYLSDNRYKIRGSEMISDAFLSIATNNSYHPIKDYIENLEWDGVNRAETLFIDHLGAEDTVLNRAFTIKMLCGAIRRVFEPGCKFDYAVVLTGPEGIGKSKLLATLGKNWFSEDFSFNMLSQPNKAQEAIRGVWIVEISELAGIKKAEVEQAKGFISRRVDEYRAAFALDKLIYPRQCVFIGTTNVEDFLVSKTGDRRFWPVKVGVTEDMSDLEPDDIDQIWAEAYYRYLKGEKLYLPSNLEKQARELQATHSEIDDRTVLIEDFLNSPITSDWYSLSTQEKSIKKDFIDKESTLVRQRVSGVEIAVEGLGMNINSHSTKFIYDYMKKHPDWEYKAKLEVDGYKRGRGFVRKQRDKP